MHPCQSSAESSGKTASNRLGARVALPSCMTRFTTILALLVGAAITLVALPSRADGPGLPIGKGFQVGVSSVAEEALQRKHIDVSSSSRLMWDDEANEHTVQHHMSHKGYGLGLTLRCAL